MPANRVASAATMVVRTGDAWTRNGTVANRGVVASSLRCRPIRVSASSTTPGPLSNARYLEPVGEINIHFGFCLGWGTSAAPAWLKAA